MTTALAPQLLPNNPGLAIPRDRLLGPWVKYAPSPRYSPSGLTPSAALPCDRRSPVPATQFWAIRSWADQSESATTMTTEAVIVGRGGGLLTWDGRL
jgi:hypothetical protein